MNSKIIGNVFKNLVGYFVIVFVGTFIIDKIFSPLDDIPLYILKGQYLKTLILAAFAYALYFLAASFIAENSTDGSGKFAVLVIFIYAVFNMYGDINYVAGTAEGARYVGSAIAYMLYALPETLRIIATFHAMNQR